MTRWRGDHPDELISASLTGELTELERGELNEHLATCSSCVETLAAFRDERRLVSGLRPMSPPRDLHARVRAGIEAGSLAAVPWWRRSGSVLVVGVSLATVATAALSIVVFVANLPGPVGQTGSPGPSASASSSASVGETTAPSQSGSPAPVAFLGSGELGYLSLNGAPFEPLSLRFVNDDSGASIVAGEVSGAPIAAAVSPDGAWLAYITVKGETGATETWAMRLADGAVTHLGCSQQAPFADRLAWSPDSQYLAYTLIGIDLGSAAGCPATDSQPGSADVWVQEVDDGTLGERRKVASGNAYVGSFIGGSAVGVPENETRLLVSFAEATPYTIALQLAGGAPEVRIDGVFLPLVSPDGNRAIFWNGTMAQREGGAWEFSAGGMPQLSGDFRSTGPASPWLGTPIFDPVALGHTFVEGQMTWSADGNTFALWSRDWTGTVGKLGSSSPVVSFFVGQTSGPFPNPEYRSYMYDMAGPGEWIVSIAIAGDGASVVVTIGVPSAGIGDPPSSRLLRSSLLDGSDVEIGRGAGNPPWNGPALFGP